MNFRPFFPSPRRGRLGSSTRVVGLSILAGATLLALRPSALAAYPALSAFAALPLSFEPAPEDSAPGSFLARGLNYQFLISSTEARLVLCKSAGVLTASPLDRSPVPGARSTSGRAVRISFLGANPQARASGSQLLPGKVNYLIGGDPAQWRVGTPTFAQVRVEQVYPGIDLVYYGNQQRLEYDFTVATGIDPATIALHFDGVDRLSVSSEGDLVLGLGADEIRQPRPVVYQVANGYRLPVVGGYRLRDPQTVTFEPGAYDHSLPLTIDPTLTYSSYFGGNSDDIAWAVKVYTNDNSIYLAGQTLSSQFPFSRPPSFGGITNHGGRYNGDGFVAKLDATGTNMVFFSYLGGEADDSVLDLALDSDGNAYVTGYTSSTNFPVVPQTGIPGMPSSTNIAGTVTPAKLFFSDAFVAELTNDGSALIFSAFLGGSQRDSGIGICLDPSRNIYITGYTYSTNFPTTNALLLLPQQGNLFPGRSLSGSNDVFVTKLAPHGGGVIYSTYLGGTNFDVGQGIAADQDGNAYVTGYTCSTNFPVNATLAPFTGQLNNTPNAKSKYDGVRVPPYDAFVAKIAPEGRRLLYSVFLGGTNNDSGSRIRVDPAGGVYVCGSTVSPEFPILPNVMTNFYSPGLTNRSYPNTDAFLTKIVDTNNIPSIQYSVHFGGTGEEVAWDLAINPVTTNIFVVGSTTSTNFVTFLNSETNAPFQVLTNMPRSNDVFVASFAAVPFPEIVPTYVISNGVIVQTIYTTVTNSILTNLYSVTLGGLRGDFGFGVDVDAADDAYLVGQTSSVDFPTLNPLQPGLAGLSDAFLAKLQFADSLTSVSVDTIPPHLQLIVDGLPCTAPWLTNWVFGSTHSIYTPPVQTNAPGSQVVWSSWSNGGAISNRVVPYVSHLSLVASNTTQYLLTTKASGGGIVNPPSGWYDAGSVVSVSATPAAGASFAGWAVAGPGSSASGNPATVTLAGPVLQIASFTGTLTDQIVVLTQGPGVVSPTYAGETLVPGRNYTITAQASVNGVFTGWTGSLPSLSPSLSFTMATGLVFQANFSTNGFLSTQGTYNGLFSDTNDIPFQTAYQSSGSFSASVTASGSFSASFHVANGSYSCSGSFVNGAFTRIISRSSPLLPLQVSLTLDPTGPGRITGYISGYTWTAPIEAERAAFSSAHPAPQGGRKYTLRIPGSTNSLVEPGGEGFATISVNSAGQVSVSGTLGDGTKFTQSASLSAFERWPLYSSLYSSKGLVLGWLSFTNDPASQPGGPLFWSRYTRPGKWFYPSGFALYTPASGSLFAFTNEEPILKLTTGHLLIENGGLGQNITNAFSLSDAHFTPTPSTNKISLSANPSSGTFQGSFYDPGSRKSFSFYGALFQGQTNGAGYFVNTNQAGRVIIGP